MLGSVFIATEGHEREAEGGAGDGAEDRSRRLHRRGRRQDVSVPGGATTSGAISIPQRTSATSATWTDTRGSSPTGGSRSSDTVRPTRRACGPSNRGTASARSDQAGWLAARSEAWHTDNPLRCRSRRRARLAESVPMPDGCRQLRSPPSLLACPPPPRRRAILTRMPRRGKLWTCPKCGRKFVGRNVHDPRSWPAAAPATLVRKVRTAEADGSDIECG